MSDLDRYLLDTEQSVATVRRHWAVLIGQAGAIGASWLVWLWLLYEIATVYLVTAAAFYFVFSLAWLGWWVADWWQEIFAVTDKRILLVNGLLTTRVAVMPLSKVTDLTYERPPLGRVLGYGTFIFESAGQDQALSRIEYVAEPDELYHRLSEELFGRKRPSKLRAQPFGPEFGAADPTAGLSPGHTTDRLPRVP